MKLLIVLCAVAAIAALCAVLFPRILFRLLFARPSRSTKIPKYYVDTPHYKVSRAGMALLKSLPCEDHYLRSRDGLRLHAYLFPPAGGEPPKKFLLGIHGYRSYSRPEFAPYAEFYRSHGFALLLPDDRAHAPSEGAYIGFGVLDRLDCVDWARHLVDTYGEDIEILLHGVSMGGATVTAAAGEPELPGQVRGVIADCAFSSACGIVEYHLRESIHLPVRWLLPALERVCEKKAGFDFHRNTPLELVRSARVPMLFVQGGRDTMVPPYMAQELYRACSSKKDLLLVEEAGHGESIAFAPQAYYHAIEALFPALFVPGEP